MSSIRKATRLGAFYAIAVLAFGCGGEETSSGLEGTWGVRSIVGVDEALGSEHSSWEIRSDGTYSWCINLGPYVLNGDGEWSMSGTTLQASGVIVQVTDSEEIPLDLQGDTLHFNDDEGKQWTYVRDAEATCD